MSGLTSTGVYALLVLVMEAGTLAITGRDGTEVAVEVGETVPALGSPAALLGGVLTCAWETVAAGWAPADAPRLPHGWGLVVTADHPSDGMARIELPGAALCLPSLQRLCLSSELLGLLARRSAAAIDTRAELEQLLARSSAEVPP